MDIRKAILTRFGMVYATIVLFCIYIIIRVFIIQHMPRWDKEAQKLDIKEFALAARRGDICAADGSPLATSVPYYELRMDLGAPGLAKIFYHEVDSLALCLSRYLRDKSVRTYRAELRRAYAQQKHYFLISTNKVSYAQLQEIKKFPILRRGRNKGGLMPEQEDQRVYPSGNLAMRTLGKLTKSETEGSTGNAGAFGLEKSFEKELKGEDGVAVKQNMSGRWFIISKDDPEDGQNVVTTLDVKMQDQVTYSLKLQMEKSHAAYGTAILMEVKTGDIKAIANFGRNGSGQLMGGYQNYAIGNAGCSEPGSTFKLASLMAAFEDGKIDTSTIVDTGSGLWKYKGEEIKDSEYKKGGAGHGKITAKRAFELSSNVGLAKLITQSYAGEEKDFVRRIGKLGMLEELKLGIQGEAKPYIRKPGDKLWSGVSLAWLSFGYELKVTPLQTLTFYNAVANGGTMMRPRLVKGITENGSIREKVGTERLIWSICSARTLRMARAMLEGVVTNGTAKALQTKYYKIAGKTGTALVANNKEGYSHGGQKIYQSSFAGYFPADNPKYSCIVVINAPQGGNYYGSSVAGPVFRQISDYVYAYELGLNEDFELPVAKIENDIPGITAGRKKDIAGVLDELDILNGFAFTKSDWVEAKPDEDGLELTNRVVQKGTVPNVKGMGATDAVFLLENNGMRVSVRGRGKVKSQSVRAGSKIQRGQSIVLKLS
jgi:cell division protein FtsI (penicillin-binding protein 3)